MASDERHASVDFEIVPDLVCGRSYRNPESEALAVAMRAGEVTPYTGCGKPLRWVYAYRCRQCGRWLHGPCMDRHFGGIDLTAELAAAQARGGGGRGGAGVSRTGQGGPVVRACPVCRRQVIHAFRGDVSAIGEAQIVRVDRDGNVYVACVCGKTNIWHRERPATV